jgi:hypothetical protein
MTFEEAVKLVFMLGLLSGVGLAYWRGNALLVRSAWVLLLNHVACDAAQDVTGLSDPTLWFAAIDTLSAVVLLWQPAGRTQAVIGAVYVVQIGLHFGQYPGGVAQYEYLSVLTVAGACQIASLIMGAVDGDGRKVRSFGDWRGNHDRALAHGAGGLEKGRKP